MLDPEPGGAARLGAEKTAVTPQGRPAALSEIMELNPFPTVVFRVTVVLWPSSRLAEPWFSANVKLGGSTMLTLKEANCVRPPPVAMTCMVEEPAGTSALAINMSWLEPEPGAANLAGVRRAVIPLGRPATDSATGAEKLPETRTVTPTVTPDDAVR